MIGENCHLGKIQHGPHPVGCKLDLRSLKQHFNWIPRPWKPLKWYIINESSPLRFKSVIYIHPDVGHFWILPKWHCRPLGQLWCYWKNLNQTDSLLPLEHPWLYQWIFILDGLIFRLYLLTYLATVFPYKLAHLAEYRYIN